MTNVQKDSVVTAGCSSLTAVDSWQSRLSGFTTSRLIRVCTSGSDRTIKHLFYRGVQTLKRRAALSAGSPTATANLLLQTIPRSRSSALLLSFLRVFHLLTLICPCASTDWPRAVIKPTARCFDSGRRDTGIRV